ncbi:MAG: Ppx/GppA phosphatase family protein [Pseudomonadales bacterium]
MQACLAAHQRVGKNNLAAAIDLGSNSFHILVAEFIDGRMQPVHCWGEKIQLADGLDQQESLTDAAKQRAFACLSRFAEVIEGVPSQRVKVVGTEALRRASDSAEFVAQAEALLGVPINVISGEQEARIIYQGVLDGKKARHQAVAEPVLIIDIGGGSTELVLGKGNQIVACTSLPLGCVSYSRRFFPNQSSDQVAFDSALELLHAELVVVRETFNSSNWQQTIGTAGTALAIEEVLQALGWVKSGINRTGLERLADVLCQGESMAALQLPGLSEERFDIITAGVVIMLAVFQAFDIKELETSSDSLREGLIYSLQP